LVSTYDMNVTHHMYNVNLDTPVVFAAPTFPSPPPPSHNATMPYGTAQ